jgi:hypothetical protein
VKRRALLISFVLLCAVASVMFWNLREDKHLAAPPSSPTIFALSAPPQRPSFQIPTSSALESSAIKAIAEPIGTPPLMLASNTITKRTAISTDRQLLIVTQVLRDYRASLGENPVGTNAEITNALLGANTRKARFVSDEVKVIDGQLVDRWNHPYFFHQLSRSQMQVRSAGPDGKMWTADDELSR